MVVWNLQEDEIAFIMVLRPLWRLLETLYGPNCKSEIEVSEADLHAGQYLTESPRQSPRHGRQPQNRRRGRNQGKGGLKGQKGSYASQGPAQTAQPLAPPPPAPWMSMPAAPGTSASSATAAEKRLNEVLGLLNRQDQDALSSDLQAFVQKESAKQTKVNAKQLHSAVDVLTEAEKAMDAALNARTNLQIASWRTFLAASLATWRDYTDQFQTQEAQCQADIQAAQEASNKAKANFDTQKPKADDAHVISDDEEANAQAAQVSTTRILSGLENMTNSLTELSAQAEQEHQEAQRRSKRPRRGDNKDVITVDMAEEGDAPPFGGPGH